MTRLRHGPCGRYGDAILAPDLMIDMVAQDGAVVGRAMLLPIPDSLSADGPAPRPVSIRVGKDATVLATVPVPPRQAVVLPPRAPRARADVYINFYEVSKTIPEKILTAYGTGRPTGKDVSVKSRSLTQEKADEHVRIDLSSLPADRFPAVAWLFHRRTYLWRDGGFLPEIRPIPAPPLRGGKPTKVISNLGRFPHALPILFVGPEPEKDRGRSPLDSPVVGGMSSALLGDALRREAGLAIQTLADLSTIGERVSDRAARDKGDTMTSNTYVNITIPPHTAVPGAGGVGQSSIYDFAGATPWRSGPGGAPFRGWSLSDPYTGKTYHDPSGFYDQTTGRLKPGSAPGPAQNQVTFNPATGATSSAGAGSSGFDFGVALGPGGNPIGTTVSPRRRSRP